METKMYLKKIITSDNESKKEEVMDLFCELMSEIEDKDYHEEMERRIYEISEGKVLNEEKARHLIEHMKPFGMK
jgi:hypothetical protein